MEILTFTKNNQYFYFKLCGLDIEYLQSKGTCIKKKNGLVINWDNDEEEEEVYYLINDVYIAYDEFITQHKCYQIILNDKSNIFYASSNVLINLDETYKFKVIDENLMIININNINIFYKIDEKLKHYILIKTPNDFDLKGYQKYTDIQFDNWYSGLEHYMTFNYNLDYHEKIKIYYLNKIHKCVLNLSHEYLKINNQFYKFFINNDILNLNTNPFNWIENNVVFKNNLHKNIQFIKKNDIYINCVNDKKIIYYYGTKNYIIDTFIHNYESTQNVIFVEYDNMNKSENIFLFQPATFEINLKKIIYIYDNSWQFENIEDCYVLYQSEEIKNIYSSKNLKNEYVLKSFYTLTNITKQLNNNIKIGIFGGNILNLLNNTDLDIELYNTNSNMLFYDFVELHNINMIIISFEIDTNYEFLQQSLNSSIPVLFENLDNIMSFIDNNSKNIYTYKFQYIQNIFEDF